MTHEAQTPNPPTTAAPQHAAPTTQTDAAQGTLSTGGRSGLFLSSDILHLQRTLGNRAVGRVLAQMTQRQSMHTTAERMMDQPATAHSGAEGAVPSGESTEQMNRAWEKRVRTTDQHNPALPTIPLPIQRVQSVTRTHMLPHDVSQHSILNSMHVQRFGDEEVAKRAKELWEEKGEPQQDEHDEQTDITEAQRQLQAEEDAIHKNLDSMYKKEQIDPNTVRPGQQDRDRNDAAFDVANTFTLNTPQDYSTFTRNRTLWDSASLTPVAKTLLDTIRTKLRAYRSDLATATYKQKKSFLEALELEINSWLSNHGTASKVASDTLLLLKRFTFSQERRKIMIANEIKDLYGITLNNKAGVDAARNTYDRGYSRGTIEKLIGPKDWTLPELTAVKQSLEKYSPMLGSQRDTESLGPQTLTTFSRAQAGLDADPDTGKPISSTSTKGETFKKSNNISLYDNALQVKMPPRVLNISKFTDKDQAFRSVIEHELSHALIEQAQKSGSKKIINQFCMVITFWKAPDKSPYWDEGDPPTTNVEMISAWHAAKDAQVEAPITYYGATNAREDLAESLSYFFEQPENLKRNCPERFDFIHTHLKDMIDPGFLEERIKPLIAPADQTPSVLNPASNIVLADAS